MVDMEGVVMKGRANEKKYLIYLFVYLQDTFIFHHLMLVRLVMC